MGADALLSNGMTHKIKYLMQDRLLTPQREPLAKVRKSRIWLFIIIQLVGFGATFAITQTIGEWSKSPSVNQEPKKMLKELFEAAIGFPVIIMLLIPLRILVIPRLPFTSEELSILDGPTASPFVRMFSRYQVLSDANTVVDPRPWSPLVVVSK